MRRRSLLPVLLTTLLATLLAASLSGCLAGSGDPITMKDGLSDARDAAKDWGTGIHFAGAVAIEPFAHVEDRDEDGTLRGEFETHLDRNPGDGRAPGWLYAFTSEDGRCILIAYASGLGVLAEGWEECDLTDEELQPMPDGILDSDEVADRLADLDGWPEPGDATVMTWTLASEDGMAAWVVLSSDLEGETDSVVAVVDAVSGEAVLVDGSEYFGFGGFGEGGYEGGSTWGSASAAALTPLMPLEIEVEVGDNTHIEGTVAVGTTLTSNALFQILDQGGKVWYEQNVLGAEEYAVDGLPEGTYTLRLTHPNLALTPSMSYDASWMNPS